LLLPNRPSKFLIYQITQFIIEIPGSARDF
jgi:hypothetical protein